MDYIGNKNIFTDFVYLLNQPIVKESVKTLAGVVTFGFGIVEVYDLYQILRGRRITTEEYADYPLWVGRVNKTIIIFAKISIILSASVSRPGIFIISSFMSSVFSASLINQVFGEYTIFAINPWHPRHIISIVAVIFALPSFALSTYYGMCWAYKKIRNYRDLQINRQEVRTRLTDTKIRLMTLFNTITSRPVLHLGNRLARFMLGTAR